MARGDPGPYPGADPGSRPGDDRGVEVDGHSGLVAPRDRLHRGGVHEGRETHVRPGGQDSRPIAPLQFQLGRQHTKGDRHPRRGEGRRGRVQGAREGRGGPEWPAGEETVDPEVQFRAAARGACTTPRRGWWSGCCLAASYRQWVLTVPFPLRLRIARDPGEPRKLATNAALLRSADRPE